MLCYFGRALCLQVHPDNKPDLKATRTWRVFPAFDELNLELVSVVRARGRLHVCGGPGMECVCVHMG